MTRREPPTGGHVCLITSTHLSRNPRIVKEADALYESGYQVTVVAAQYMQRWEQFDNDLVADRGWRFCPVIFSIKSGRLAFHWTRLRQHVCARLPEALWPLGVAERSLGRVTPELRQKAVGIKAQLYIAHNLQALPAAHAASKKQGALLAFDAEDFHSGELPQVRDTAGIIKLTRWLERKYLPCCHSVTAASPGIAEAYRRLLEIPMPATVLNAFPLSEAPDRPFAATKQPGPSLYWFSQTIGTDRGIQDVICALSAMQAPAHLYLRGEPADGVRSCLEQIASEKGVLSQIHFLPVEPPEEMIRKAAEFDIGLALELPVSRNKEICISNKMLTYLLAGIPVVATDTEGQRELGLRCGDAVALFKPGDWRGLGSLLDLWLQDPERLRQRRASAWTLGQEKFNWDREKEVFLHTVRRMLPQ